MNKKISVIIPVYNAEKYLKRCIESVINQTYKNLEIIMVDDGSKDNTQTIGEEYAMKYPGIVRVIKQENGGHGEAVNTGLRNARGLYYKVVDSDDWVEEKSLHEILDKLKEFIENRNMIDMLITNYVYEKVELNKQKVIEIFKED